MKKLIITAHPSSHGFSHKIAAAYRDASVEIGHEVEIIDLYAPEWHQDFLKFEETRQWPADPVRETIQKKILESGELIFAFPMWWAEAPAIFKNFLDCNITAGFAYKFTGKPLPDKLLLGKTSRVFMTCDGPKFFQFLLGMPFRKVLVTAILGYCGIKNKSFVLFDRMRKRKDDEKEKMLEQVKEMARR